MNLQLDSTSLFKPEKEFFIIDSKKLKSVENSLYGYCIQDSSIVKNFNDLDENKIDGNGVYIYIKNDGKNITIKQDYIGCYGIYLYQNDDYFALSNSFQYLVDYIKKHYPISFNQDYANALLCTGLCAMSYSETMINEITMIDRCAVVEIDITTKKINYSYINYEEQTIEPDSEEGLKILDNWHNKWVSIIRNTSNKNMQFDLTGGMDSRIVFLLLLNSGVQHDTVLINSVNDTLHSHKEDFEIATEIANKYNFKLNNTNDINSSITKFSEKDLLNISFYTKLGFHKKMFPSTNTGIYRIGGHCGGMLRNFLIETEETYISNTIKYANIRYRKSSKKTREMLLESTKKILRTSFEQIRKKYKTIDNKIIKDMEAGRFLYKETRNRNHFGKILAESQMMGVTLLCPLADTQLLKLKTNSQNCQDYNLLITLILSRFSDLLEFKFEGGRFIEESTIEYANTINNKYPFTKKDIITVPVTETSVNTDSIKDESYVNDNSYNLMVKIFHSKPVKKLFKSLYGCHTYWKIDRICKREKFQPLRDVYSAISIYKAVQDVEISKNISKDDIIEQIVK